MAMFSFKKKRKKYALIFALGKLLMKKLNQIIGRGDSKLVKILIYDELSRS